MKKEAEGYENDFCTLFFYNGRLLDAIAGKEGEGLRRDRLAADHDGDGRRAGDRRCGADAAHGLGGRDHLLRCTRNQQVANDRYEHLTRLVDLYK